MDSAGSKHDEGVYCASEKAIQNATTGYFSACGQFANPAGLAHALICAHHPSLGSDRSVCLRDVIEVLERAFHPQNPTVAHPADVVTKHFHGEGHEGLDLSGMATVAQSVMELPCECENAQRAFYTGRDGRLHCEQCDGVAP
jgi:hypothetical protein